MGNHHRNLSDNNSSADNKQQEDDDNIPFEIDSNNSEEDSLNSEGYDYKDKMTTNITSVLKTKDEKRLNALYSFIGRGLLGGLSPYGFAYQYFSSAIEAGISKKEFGEIALGRVLINEDGGLDLLDMEPGIVDLEGSDDINCSGVVTPLRQPNQASKKCVLFFCCCRVWYYSKMAALKNRDIVIFWTDFF